jgi:hypothetical protein
MSTKKVNNNDNNPRFILQSKREAFPSGFRENTPSKFIGVHAQGGRRCRRRRPHRQTGTIFMGRYLKIV